MSSGKQGQSNMQNNLKDRALRPVFFNAKIMFSVNVLIKKGELYVRLFDIYDKLYYQFVFQNKNLTIICL